MRRAHGALWLTTLTGTFLGLLPPPPGAPPPPVPRELPGLHNVFRLTPRLLSGSGPEGDAGFASLRRLGVRTVLSVDGARPEVERARRFGLRYVHLPIGYDGVPEAQGLRIARAVRDLPGPIYLHCHHGKHRGPAAAAVAWLCLDPSCGAAEAIASLRRAGTDPRYEGLYESTRTFPRPAPAQLDAVPADFPEVAPVPALTQLMVEVDTRWDHLRQAQAAGWKAPPHHPDIDPPHEALLLTELYREAGRQPVVRSRPEAFRQRLGQAEQTAMSLEQALRKRDMRAADGAFHAGGALCTACHAQHRDRLGPR